MFNKGLILILLLNFIIYGFSYQMNLDRSILNIDYILCITVAIILNGKFKLFLSMLFMTITIIDVLALIVQIFPFIYVEDFFYLIFFIADGPIHYKQWSVIIVLSILSLGFIFYNIDFTLINKKYITLLLALSIVTGTSQSLAFGEDQYNKYKEIKNNFKLRDNMKYDYISKDIANSLTDRSDKLLLIVNESWGMTHDLTIQQDILSPIYSNTNYYDIISDGSFDFEGSTVSGELRELCQKYANIMNIVRVEDKDFNGCLPSKLSKEGYKTYAMHGTDGELYDRKRWYRLAGFENILFKNDFKEARDCKTFSGKCDYDLFEPLANILGNNDKVFVYWLTLNTHSPYDDRLFLDGFNCANHGIKTQSETCLNLKQQYQFFYRLSEYLKDERMKGVEVYVVGDHTPPIISLKDNFNTFRNSEVGWLKLKVKDSF